MSKEPNILGNSDNPLFYPIDGETRVSAPDNRMGDAVRLYVRSLSVMQKEAVVACAGSDISWRLTSDEGAYLNGFDEAPCPLSFLTTGMVSSYMNEILSLAKKRGIAINNIRLIQDNYYTMKGSALKGTMTGGAKNIDLEAQIDSDGDTETLRSLIYDAISASPLNGLMRGEKESLFTLNHNGENISMDKAKAVGENLDEITPCDLKVAVGDWSGIINKAGVSPKTKDTNSSHGSSLADEQDRLLHLRAICTLRDDGVKMIEQHLYNPHGSIFHYLCDENDRAPNAISYIAAGIGFCFMTQLGRYAKIARKDLHGYTIIQDMHFSKGGASGGTGKAGEAAPVETHVYIKSGEDDDFARTTLDMSEQTCFLHAFCRTDLKAKIKISDY
ncbi:MAG: OsmC family protein [Kordiimonadaceae bacterium]|nr:OsmC family protein [Kordiimonadaceae bacterium]MBT6035704.1 OsmC family protein [Kordiimonadaceae bacterium]MBT6330525.1 OsmC family protein [Kordiimonadaceae bacterium]